MIAYVYITVALILYPVFGYFLNRWSRRHPIIQQLMTGCLLISSAVVIFSMAGGLITISQHLNWFLVTTIYLAASFIVWKLMYVENDVVKKVASVLKYLLFGTGYLCATIGCFLVLLASFHLDTDQWIRLSNDLIYEERNIGMGPDPSVRRKTVEVYKRKRVFPLLAQRIAVKVYDEWAFPLKKKLDVTYSGDNRAVYLASTVNGDKVFSFADTIRIADVP